MFVDFKFDYIRIDDPDDDFSDDMVEKKFEIDDNGVMKPCTCSDKTIQDNVNDDSHSGKFYEFLEKSSLCFTGMNVFRADVLQIFLL